MKKTPFRPEQHEKAKTLFLPVETQPKALIKAIADLCHPLSEEKAIMSAAILVLNFNHDFTPRELARAAYFHAKSAGLHYERLRTRLAEVIRLRPSGWAPTRH
ncbi:hypothetical protein ACGYLX_18940 [Sulfitobacter sp. 1A13496]|uniref:hypothetical protein n=1 Tax=Sulfitobacter sp. 1A13496 TaxID=3368596 RepID=UPI003746A505